jgi:Rrf2 family protein
MKLTKSADFALRIVIHLAQNPSGSTMPFLAETLKVPYNNLSKLIQQMARGGIIQTRQGKNGGVALISPENLSIKDVVQLIDGPTRLSECLKNHDFCSRVGECKLKGVLADIQHDIDHLLDSYKIAQLV